MRIGIDISQIVYETGVSWYTENLVKNLLKTDTQNQYLLFGGALRQAQVLRQKVANFEGNFKFKSFPVSPVMADRIWNQWHYLPLEVFTGRLDLVHTSDWSEPYSLAQKVTTIHDLSPFIYPQYVYNDKLRNIYQVHQRKYKWVKKERVQVIAVSASTKKDAIEILNIPENQISVVYEAPDTVYRPQLFKDILAVKQKYGLRGDYLLFVGTSPRKNLEKTLAAFRLLKNHSNLTLVVVGHQKPAGDGFLFIKSPTNQELACLYSGAGAFVYPSMYEGFGLPILEAMACGTPAVISKIPVFKEVAGNAALYVNPNSPFEIACGITEVLKKRDWYQKRGLIQVKQFSWEKTASDTLLVYQKIQTKN